MPAEIVVPELGESVFEATVARWLKREGDRVSAGETVVELETDKVNLEIGASSAGVLAKIERQESEDVKVGDVLGIVEQEAEPSQPSTEKHDESVPAGQEEESPMDAEPEPASPAREEQPDGPAPAEEQVTPVAARIAREQGVDLGRIRGTGPGGRVTRGDVEAFLLEQKESPKGEPTRPKQVPQAPKDEGFKPVPAAQSDGRAADQRTEERVKMSRRRRTIASRLVEAQQTAAMLSTFNEVDMSAVMTLRERRNPAFLERHGIKLGFTSFFVKASIGALKAFPRLNAEVDGNEMVLKHYYDIGIAVGDPEGLVVPVLRDADRLSFVEIERQVKDLASKAQEGRLSLEDLRGGTFTITNGGVFGSLLSTPILSYPQVGILGLHKIEKRPVAVDDQVVIRPMMYAALTYDHRIVDGREAVQFLVRVKELIEDPETLLLEG
jgi:2-oxoglutarate dehydrogenase E2 component (dihydrolipoamide succinyltransferase)